MQPVDPDVAIEGVGWIMASARGCSGVETQDRDDHTERVLVACTDADAQTAAISRALADEVGRKVAASGSEMARLARYSA